MGLNESDARPSHEGRSEPPLQRWRARWQAFRQPIAEEKARVLKERWDSLPLELRTDNQIAGRHLTHCGFTLGASYCSFHCTHCYLPKNANSIPIPSLAQVKEQIDANRRFQGPGGGLQITGGDVADAYWRAGRGRRTNRDRALRHFGRLDSDAHDPWADADRAAGISRAPHGGRRAAPDLRPRRHDAGRAGTVIRSGGSNREADLHPGSAGVHRSRACVCAKRPGCFWSTRSALPSRASNIDDVPEVLRWYLADPQRSYIWRMISFQPEADTGRTIFSERPITLGGRLGKNLRRRRLAAAARRFHFRPSGLQQLGFAPVARPSGKIFPAPARRQEIRHVARRSACARSAAFRW